MRRFVTVILAAGATALTLSLFTSLPRSHADEEPAAIASKPDNVRVGLLPTRSRFLW